MSPNARARGRAPVFLAFAGFALFWGCWGALLPAVQESAGVDDRALGLALLMVGLGALLTMRATGALVDRYGPRVLPLTALALAAAALGPALVSGGAALAAALLLLGAASGAMDVAMSAAAVARETAERRPLLNLANAAFSATVVVASLAAGGLRAAGVGPLAVFGGVALVLVGLAATVLRPARGAPRPVARARGPRPRRLLPAPTLLVLGGLGGLAYLVENAWQSWGAVHLESTLDAPAGISAAAPATFAACAAVGRVAGNRLLSAYAAPALLPVAAAVAALGSLLAALAPTAPVALAGIALAGTGTSVCMPTLVSVAGAWAGDDRQASATSSVAATAYLGFLVGPAVVGLVAGAASLRAALVGVAALAALLCVLAPAVGWAARRPRR
ncbi:MFS transporter [Motilibacter aurantiacus]|uniref:MFS transporter n=1 Tax=Motilibacter aurantiacus TaxID=2714955 RepID=UPI001409D593|nr:MFS transporter [Motilibacter aurantiacus]